KVLSSQSAFGLGKGYAVCSSAVTPTSVTSLTLGSASRSALIRSLYSNPASSHPTTIRQVLLITTPPTRFLGFTRLRRAREGRPRPSRKTQHRDRACRCSFRRGYATGHAW